MMAMLVHATLPSGDVYGHLSGELLDPLPVHAGREEERENLRKFGVYERVPRHQANWQESSSPVVRRLLPKHGRFGLYDIQTCIHADGM